MAGERSTLFDPSQARGPKRGPDVGAEACQTPGPGAGGAAAISVSLLITRIKGALSGAFPQNVLVIGELSNVKLHSSGHLYFRLKDGSAAIDAAMFRSRASKLRFQPTDGLEVIVEGRVDVYDPRGQLQLCVENLTPRGDGALELAFRQMREKLRAEGLFEASAKKPIPRFPRAVGVITSPTGAAIRDIRRALLRRWPGIPLYLVPVLVQGPGAAEQIAEAVRLLDAAAGGYEIDTILVARGGGSLEDLWAFNEEIVARAIFAARTPIISGVGHEVDVTICDMVADLRAATPTAAAEQAVPSRQEIVTHIEHLHRRLNGLLRDDLLAARAALRAALSSVVFRDPRAALRTQTQRIDELAHRLRAGARQMVASDRRRLDAHANRLAALHPAKVKEQALRRLQAASSRLAWVLGARSKRSGDAVSAVESRLAAVHPIHRLKLARQQVESARRQLEAMSHRSVLRRGFSVTRGEGGRIVRSAAEVQAGQRVETEVSDGRFRSRIEGDQSPAPGPKPAARRRPRRDDDSQGTLFQ